MVLRVMCQRLELNVSKAIRRRLAVDTESLTADAEVLAKYAVALTADAESPVKDEAALTMLAVGN